MIPNAAPVVEIDNHLGGERIDMKISKKGMRYLMVLLTDLYSDQALACIREYSTNAWDSHLDAGQTRPIEVSTPTTLSPYLVIKDFGIGMDATTIRDIYSQYGESTKREQEDSNGSMGIGAKAALSVASQFNVTGIKNGVKTLVSVSRNSDGSGVMEIVYTGKTDEPNGVEIKIPADRHGGYDTKAKKFFQFWKRGTVLLNGEDPTVDFEMITDRIALLDGNFTNDVVVMGNVAYPVSYAYRFSVGNRHAALFVKMGEDDQVSFTPSREELMYDAHTKGVLVEARKEFSGAIADHISAEIAMCSNFAEAFAKYQQYRHDFSNNIVGSLMFDKKPVRDFYLTDGTGDSFRMTFWNPARARNSVDGNMTVSYSKIIDSDHMVIVNYPSRNGVPSNDKRRIRDYVVKHGLYGNRLGYNNNVLLTSASALPMSEYTSGIKVYDWKVILEETRAQRKASGPVWSAGGMYNTFTDTGWKYMDVTSKDEIVYWSSARDNGIRPTESMVRALHKEFPNIKFISEAKNRHEKLTRIVKSATPWVKFHAEYRVNKAKQEFDALTADDLRHIAYNEVYGEGSVEETIGVSYWNRDKALVNLSDRLDKIADPEYAKVVEALCNAKTVSNDVRGLPEFKREMYLRRPMYSAIAKKHYPLLTGDALVKNTDHAIEYINFVYANRMEK